MKNNVSGYAIGTTISSAARYAAIHKLKQEITIDKGAIVKMVTLFEPIKNPEMIDPIKSNGILNVSYGLGRNRNT